MTEIKKINELLKQLSPAYVHKVLVYARTLKEIQDERKEG